MRRRYEVRGKEPDTDYAKGDAEASKGGKQEPGIHLFDPVGQDEFRRGGSEELGDYFREERKKELEKKFDRYLKQKLDHGASFFQPRSQEHQRAGGALISS